MRKLEKAALGWIFQQKGLAKRDEWDVMLQQLGFSGHTYTWPKGTGNQKRGKRMICIGLHTINLNDTPWEGGRSRSMVTLRSPPLFYFFFGFVLFSFFGLGGRELPELAFGAFPSQRGKVLRDDASHVFRLFSYHIVPSKCTGRSRFAVVRERETRRRRMQHQSTWAGKEKSRGEAVWGGQDEDSGEAARITKRLSIGTLYPPF